MKISIITAVYNRIQTIESTLLSVASQSYVNIEHVIQDGCSTDGTLEIVKDHKLSAAKLISEPDFGIYDALNRGILNSTGDIIGFLHSDDIFADENVISSIAAVFSNYDVDGVYGDLDYVLSSDPSKTIRRWRSESYDFNKLRKGWMPPHPTLFLRKEVYQRFGLYDPMFRISGDYEAMLRYLIIGKINVIHVPNVITKMRVGGVSNGSVRNLLRKSFEDYKAIKMHRVGGCVTLLRKNLSKIKQFL